MVNDLLDLDKEMAILTLNIFPQGTLEIEDNYYKCPLLNILIWREIVIT
jgi:hypothetical protein